MATCNHHFSSKVRIAAVSFYMLSFFSVGGKQLNDLYLRRQIINTPTIIKKKKLFWVKLLEIDRASHTKSSPWHATLLKRIVTGIKPKYMLGLECISLLGTLFGAENNTASCFLVGSFASKRGEPGLPGRIDAAKQLSFPASISGHVFCLHKEWYPIC